MTEKFSLPRRVIAYFGRKAVSAFVVAFFFVVGAILTIYAGNLLPGLDNGLDAGNNAVASMHPLDQVASKTTDGFNRETDSLEAISDKLDTLLQ